MLLMNICVRVYFVCAEDTVVVESTYNLHTERHNLKPSCCELSNLWL